MPIVQAAAADTLGARLRRFFATLLSCFTGKYLYEHFKQPGDPARCPFAAHHQATGGSSATEQAAAAAAGRPASRHAAAARKAVD